MVENKINEYVTINNGLKMPLSGLGTCNMQNLQENLYLAIKSGIRLIDTALYYKNEKELQKLFKIK